MVQSLLADRFKLKLSPASRDQGDSGVCSGHRARADRGFRPAKDPSQCGGQRVLRGRERKPVGGRRDHGLLRRRSASPACWTALALDKPHLGLTSHYDFKLTYDQSSVKPPMVGMSIAPDRRSVDLRCKSRIMGACQIESGKGSPLILW